MVQEGKPTSLSAADARTEHDGFPTTDAGDIDNVVAALERVLTLQRTEEDRPHLRRRAVYRLHQAEGALQSLLRALVGHERASAVYGEAAARVYGLKHSVAPAQPELFSATSAPSVAVPATEAPLSVGASEVSIDHAGDAEAHTHAQSPAANEPGGATVSQTTKPFRQSDVGHFDGSADPNPNGRMGMGWHVTFADGRDVSGQDERPAALGNSNNRAEYLALISLLTTYRERGGAGPILVRGDSQLIIKQVTGACRVHDAALRDLCAQAQAALQAIPRGVSFEWVARMHNARADHLASGRPDQDPGEPPLALVYAHQPNQAVAPVLAERIATLNQNGGGGFKQYAALRVGGRDACSDLRWQELISAAGAPAVALCREAFPDNRQLQGSALRWAVRGLAVQLAIKKVQVDQTLMANRATSPSV